MRNPQTVSITWMPYPENKPKKDDVYFVVIGEYLTKYILRATWRNDQFCEVENPDYYGEFMPLHIIAYAELPEPYREEE